MGRHERWRRPVPAEGEIVFYRASDLAPLGTLKQHKEARQMKVVGTGKDPLGRYPEGIVSDIPDAEDEHRSLLEMGYIRELDDKDHPGMTDLQIADAVVRGDELIHPEERKKAKSLRSRAHAIVHTGNPSAKAEEANPDLEEDEDNAPPQGRRDPDEVTHWDRGDSFTGEPRAKAKAEPKPESK